MLKLIESGNKNLEFPKTNRVNDCFYFLIFSSV